MGGVSQWLKKGMMGMAIGFLLWPGMAFGVPDAIAPANLLN